MHEHCCICHLVRAYWCMVGTNFFTYLPHTSLLQYYEVALQPSVFQIMLQSFSPAIIIGTTAPFEPRPSSEASANCPLFLAAFLQFLSPNFLASSVTPSSYLSFGLPLCLLPSTAATRTLHVALCSSIRITCPAHFNRLILMYVTISLSLYNVYNSLLHFILHSPLSFVGPKIALNIFLSKTPKIASSDFDNTQVSEP